MVQVIHVHVDTPPPTVSPQSMDTRSAFLQAIQSAFSFFQSDPNRDALFHPVMSRDTAPASSAGSAAVNYSMDNHESSLIRLADLEETNDDVKTDEQTCSSGNSNVQDDSDCIVVRMSPALSLGSGLKPLLS